jgi:hypothetical protein
MPRTRGGLPMMIEGPPRAVESRSLHNPLAYLRQAVVNLARSELRRRLVRLRYAPRPMPDAASAEEGACAAISRQEVIAVVLRYWADLPRLPYAGARDGTAEPGAAGRTDRRHRVR